MKYISSKLLNGLIKYEQPFGPFGSPIIQTDVILYFPQIQTTSKKATIKCICVLFKLQQLFQLILLEILSLFIAQAL